MDMILYFLDLRLQEIFEFWVVFVKVYESTPQLASPGSLAHFHTTPKTKDPPI
jgi:hypothetical protein